MKPKREGFATGVGLFFATLGSAVGLGNIWKFPYLVGSNGGGAFILIYLICVALVGIPIMIGEFVIGRKTHKNVVGAIEQLSPDTEKELWNCIGYFGMVSSYLLLFFYTCVAGWVYSYVFKAIRGDFVNLSTDISKAGPAVANQFTKTVVGPISPIIWQIVAIITVSIIIIAGVQKGIERVTKTLIPILLILIIICAIRALTLPGAGQGLKFLFHINFKAVNGTTILMALGLAFFKLSIGIGTMLTYGSYFRDDNNMIGTAGKVVAADTIVSLLAGIAIFPTVFTFNMKPEAGPGLLFQTIPLIFSRLPGGRILLVAFFILTAIAATTAMISIIEVLIAYFTEQRHMNRIKAVILNSSIAMVFGILATLSADKSSVLSNITIAKKGFFDLFDYISSDFLMPIVGLLIALFIGFIMKKEDVFKELSNGGKLNNKNLINIFYFIIKYVTPILIIIIFKFS